MNHLPPYFPEFCSILIEEIESHHNFWYRFRKMFSIKWRPHLGVGICANYSSFLRQAKGMRTIEERAFCRTALRNLLGNLYVQDNITPLINTNNSTQNYLNELRLEFLKSMLNKCIK